MGKRIKEGEEHSEGKKHKEETLPGQEQDGRDSSVGFSGLETI